MQAVISHVSIERGEIYSRRLGDALRVQKTGLESIVADCILQGVLVSPCQIPCFDVVIVLDSELDWVDGGTLILCRNTPNLFFIPLLMG